MTDRSAQSWRGALSSGVWPLNMRLSLVLTVLSVAAPSALAECAKYEPAVTRLVGTVTTREYPGPPNFESIAAGDTPERQWILILKRPLCVDGDPTSDLNPDSKTGVAEIQLMADRGARNLSRLSGKEVEVSGTLFAAHTGHHRVPVLLKVQSTRPNNSLERRSDR